MSQPQRKFTSPPRKKNALDEYKLRMSCPPVQGATRPGSLALSVVKNQVHIDVYTNVPNDKNNGNIRAAMDSTMFYALLELAKTVPQLEANQNHKIPNKNHTFFEGKRSEEPKLVSTTIVGRDKEGVCFIAIVAKDRPYLKFNFLPTNYHQLLGVDGNPMDPAKTSEFMLAGWINTMTQLVGAVLVAEYVEPPPKDAGNGGNNNSGGGGWKGNNNSGGGGGGWKGNNSGGGDSWGGGGSSDSGDDEFPM